MKNDEIKSAAIIAAGQIVAQLVTTEKPAIAGHEWNVENRKKPLAVQVALLAKQITDEIERQ